MTTLFSALEDNARRGGPSTTFHLHEGTASLTPAQVAEAARAAASLLAASGVGSGDRVAILGPNRPAWLVWLFATWVVDATAVPLPFPLVTQREAIGRHVGNILAAAPCTVVVAPKDLADLLPRGQRWIDWDTRSSTLHPPPPNETETAAVLQFTSGSTSAPKGVVLAHETLLYTLRASEGGIRLRPDDVKVSWLPLFHDWGFIAYGIGPLTLGFENHVLPVERFAKEPAGWFRLVTEVGGTVLPTPPSALAAATRAALHEPHGIDLSTVRRLDVAAEMIPPELFDRLREDGPQIGLDPAALVVSYGMAEMGLGATRCDVTRPVPIAEVDALALEQGRAVPPTGGGGVKRIVASGSPVEGVELEIRDAGVALPEGYVGEIALRTPHMFRGYLQDGAVTSGLEPDGFFLTGDLGFVTDGQLYVTGRRKEVVIAMGRNVPAQDIEWAAERARGVRRGRSVAFSVPGQEGTAVVLVEPGRMTDAETLAAEVHRTVGAELGLVVEAAVVPRETVQKTTSGKLRRTAAREAYLTGAVEVLARRGGRA